MKINIIIGLLTSVIMTSIFGDDPMEDKQRQTLSERSLQDFQYGAFKPSKYSESGTISILSWSSAEGKKRLFTSQYAEPFFRLANFYQPQVNSVYCGVASAVIVLNALTQPNNEAPMEKELAIPAADTGKLIPFPAYSQITFLGHKTEAVKKRSVIEYKSKNDEGLFKPGLSLSELAKLIEVHGFKVTFNHTSEDESVESGEKHFRDQIKKIMLDKQSYAIIHFRSDLLGGIPKGHISPIAAYDEASDSVLIMDVAGHKGPWYWSLLSDVYKSTAFIYDTQPKGGGLIVVSRK